MKKRSKAAFERRDVKVRTILLFGAAVTAGLVVAFAFVGVLVHGLGDAPSPEDRGEIREGIRLEVHPGEEGRRLREEAAARLSGYEWVDARAGRARIPVERAMDILVQRGWPEEDSGPNGDGR